MNPNESHNVSLQLQVTDGEILMWPVSIFVKLSELLKMELYKVIHLQFSVLVTCVLHILSSDLSYDKT